MKQIDVNNKKIRQRKWLEKMHLKKDLILMLDFQLCDCFVLFNSEWYYKKKDNKINKSN